MGSMRIIGFSFATLMFITVGILMPSILMRVLVSQYIYSDIADVPNSSTGLVLGASVFYDKPSPALEARTEEAAELYKSGKVSALIATGAVEPGYDEITPMRKSLVKAGVPIGNIATDSKGFDTYSSIYRAKNVFLTNSITIVSQDFHLPRAVFIARTMHMRAYGIAAPKGARLYDYLREIPASWKAIWDLISNRVPEDSSDIAPVVLSGVKA